MRIPSFLRWSLCIKLVIVSLNHCDMHSCILVYVLILLCSNAFLCFVVALSHCTILLSINAFGLLQFCIAFYCMFFKDFQLHTSFIAYMCCNILFTQTLVCLRQWFVMGLKALLHQGFCDLVIVCDIMDNVITQTPTKFQVLNLCFNPFF